jgi:hypothetical protein
MDVYIFIGGKLEILERNCAMKGLLLIIAVVVVWVLLQAVILPKFGVQT